MSRTPGLLRSAEVLACLFLAAGCVDREASPGSTSARAADYLWSYAFGHDTAFSPGYTEEGFRSIRMGMTDRDVLSALGQPFLKLWDYDVDGRFDICDYTRFEQDRVTHHGIRCKEWVPEGTDQVEVLTRLGAPRSVSWSYSRSPGSHNYWVRRLELKEGRVVRIDSRLYWD